jgi:uncharacterized membrane protein YjdF
MGAGLIKKIRNNFFLVTRAALFISAVINIAIVYGELSGEAREREPEKLAQISKNIESALFGLITLVLSFGSEVIERRQKIDIPDILEIVIVVFIYAGIFLSVQFNLYYTVFWWDDLLHILSGVIIGFIGFIVVYKINHKYSMDISPLLIALFSFTFAVTLGVMWEIIEFSSDALFGSAHQKWDMPETEIMMGRVVQGSGLRDTMSDLIVDSAGALITSVITYFMYKYRKKETLEDMSRILKDGGECDPSGAG